MNAQLIDARTDAHLWAQTYDRDLADVFAIQSEIAKAIADQLQATLSPSEKVAIERPPTADLVANALYVQAREIQFREPQPENLLEAVRLLDQAVARDPGFVLAYCALARVNLKLFWEGYDHTDARRELANAAIQKALQLQPDAGEVHLALAIYALQGFRDYDRAQAELDRARRTLPNDAYVYYWQASVGRRQGRWAEAVTNFARTVELDPRNAQAFEEAAGTYNALRRYAEAQQMFERAGALRPDAPFSRISVAVQALDGRADIRPLRGVLSAIVAAQPTSSEKIGDVLFKCGLFGRDAAAASRALAAIPADGSSFGGNFVYPREWFAAVSARTFNDIAAAHASFTSARVIAEKLVRAQPDYAPAWSLLGRIDAGLGRKEDATREGRHACELLPISRDAYSGPSMISHLAVIYAHTGDKDLALEQLDLSARLPAGVSYGDLQLDPEFDPLRGDPGFEKIVSSLAPKGEVPAPAPESVPSASNTVPQKSIAVLPFENLSDDKQNAYFADGIQEEVLTRLASIAQLKVISRTSTAKYKSQPEDLKTVSQQLGVATVLEGSVQKAGEKVRVNVQLVDARVDTHLWAETYDRKVTDIFAVETEIATKIADTLQAKLAGEEHTAVAARPTENMEAHELYLKGRYFQAKRTHEDTLKAIDYYSEALAKDSNYASAYAGLAESYVILPVFSRVAANELNQKARAAAERAVAINPDLAEAHTALGVVMQAAEFNFGEARREFERAIALNPNYAPAHHFLAGLVLLPLGEVDSAIAELKRALELDPLSLVIRSKFAQCYMIARRYPEAIDSLRKTIEIDPAYAPAQDILAIVLGLSGDLDGAVAQFQKSFQASGGDFHSMVYLAHFYGLKGERDKALQALEKGKQLQQQKRAEWAYGYAVAFAGLVDKEKAITWLERSYEAKEIGFS